ncbi:ABC transporter substrate-binding protein [Betaproteobacteria bacterium PRO7]|jgi:branched-chain amino acid transport system substrate-binding protein|nr:ABC transporter substrate-binding protein [Burkholderiaceae bacterium]MDL1861665.1 ABC transporter substrate-binding protein [Betaproteobacteria bacterium PRO7]GIL04548.1 MAG: ABC transporter substrate-binding protein [Betaproteobacteria bacterium]
MSPFPSPARVVFAAAFALAAGAASAQTIKVGIAQDLTGPFAALGAEARDGFNLGIKQLGGKLGGFDAEFIAQDMGGNPDNARQLVERFVKRERIDFFTGPIGSNVALAVGPALFAEKVFYLSNNAGPSQFAGSQCNPYFFGTAWQNDAYHEAAGRFAATRDFKKVAIMAPNYPAGQDALNGFKRGFGKPVAAEIYTKLGQLDYAAELAQLRAQAPDALFIFLPGGMGINFIKQFVGAGLSKTTQIIGPGFSADQDVIRAVGEPMLGMFNTAHWNHDFDNPVSKAFVEAFRKEYGRTPSIYAAQAYDVIQMLDAAVREVKGKVADKDAVRAALKKANFKSVRGPFKFGHNQYPVQDYYLRVVSKDTNGEISNKTLNKAVAGYADPYVAQCAMK